jgi:D-3-phosphoglycerate dehydrogenase
MTPTPGIHRVLIAQPIDPIATQRLEELGFVVRTASSADPNVPAGELKWADALIVRNLRIDRPMLQGASDLKVIGVHGVGTDPIDLAAATEAGVIVFNTPDSNFQSVAEHTIALLLALAKRLLPAREALRAGEHAFGYVAEPIELDGKTFGVVGFGRAGRAVARLAAGIGMRIVVLPSGRADLATVPESYRIARNLNELLAVADVVSLHVPLTANTRGMIDASRLSTMKRSALLLNTARGALVDEDALVAALRNGEIAGAGIDVFTTEPVSPDHPLLRLDRVVATPHLAGSTDGALRRAATSLIEGLVRAARGELPAATINVAAWEEARRRILG